jgi:hypothetical protein
MPKIGSHHLSAIPEIATADHLVMVSEIGPCIRELIEGGAYFIGIVTDNASRLHSI